MSGNFIVRLRGSSHSNPDGTKRQELLALCRKNQSLILRAEPNNPHDRHAVAVLNSKGQQLGYLPSDARDSSSILRGEPISAVVLKRIGGPKWWHRFFGLERKYGLLITLSKGEINWATHNKHRSKAEIVDNLVRDALAFEKSDKPSDKVIEKYKHAMASLIELNCSDPTAAAHRFSQAPINRLTMVLVKEKRFSEAIEAFQEWKAVTDPVGLTKADSEPLNKRMAKLGAIYKPFNTALRAGTPASPSPH